MKKITDKQRKQTVRSARRVDGIAPAGVREDLGLMIAELEWQELMAQKFPEPSSPNWQG